MGTGTTVGAIAGDYNLNGVVDVADYVMWRTGIFTTFTQTDYDVWRAHFGQKAGSATGVSANTAVPETATWTLFSVAATRRCVRRRRAS